MRERNAQLPSSDPRETLLSRASAGVPALAAVQYQTLRSVSDHHIFVLCCDGRFYEIVPDDVRKQGPWQGQHRGEVECLKPEFRLALARDGNMLVRCELAVFKRGVKKGAPVRGRT